MKGQRHAPAALYPGKEPVPIVQEAGWAPGLVWTGAENLAPTGIQSPDRPVRSQSLYRLRYLAHFSEVRVLWISWCPHKFHWPAQHRYIPLLKCGETWRFSVQKTQRVLDLKARNLVGVITNGEQGTNATREYGMNSLHAGCDGTSENGVERRTQG